MVDVEDEPSLEFAVQRLTDTEQEIIAQVLARDEEVRELEEMRLSRLNFELLELREKGVPEGSEDDFGRVCMRCRTPLGVVINSGSLCERCSKRVCKDCRAPYNNAWLCVVCVKEREVKAESGAWFYDNFTKKGKRVYGSALIKRFFRRVKYKEKPYERNQGIAGLPEITTVDVIPSAEVRPLFTKAATDDKKSAVGEEKKEEEPHLKLGNGSIEESRVEPPIVIMDAQERKDSFLSDTVSLESEFASSNVSAGEILLGLKFVEKEKRLEVQVHRVRDLPPADPRKHTTDPYVKVYLLPDKSKGSKRKTKIKKHSLNPEFDEILTYKLSYEDLLTRKVWVGVCHHDPLGRNSLLGEMQIIIDAYIQSGFSLEDPIPQWYTLTKRTMTRADLKDVGDIKLSLKYVPPGSVPGDNRRSKTDDPASGTLVVKVVSAKNLKSEREDSQMNPYVKLELLGDGQHKSKHFEFKTAVKSGTSHPQWDQEFAFDSVSWNGLHKRVLEVFVYDGDSALRSDFIGVTRIGLGKTENEWDDPFGPEIAIWKTMLDSPNEWNSVTIPLRSSGLSVKMDTSAPAVHVKRVQEDTLLSKDYKTGSMGSLDDVGSLKRKSLMKHADQISLSSFGSMLSIYSDAGGHGGLQITGDVLFSIKYDDIAGVFEVHVVKAKNIAIANKRTQKSDPYVKTYLLPDKSKNSKKKSAVRRRTLNPEWNENIKYKIGKDDLMKRTLQLSLWNYDKFGQNDFLGEVQVQIQKYVKSGHLLSDAEPVWYTLQDAAPISIGQPGFQGDLTLAVKYDADSKKLLVDVREAKGLPSADPNSKPHSFVKGYLLPDKTRLTKRKTKVVKSLDPKWNEKFEYESVIPEDLQACVLELTVWDQEKKENVFLGGTRIGLKSGDEAWHDCMGKEVQLWQAVIDHPNIWNEYVVPLRDSMTSRKGMDVPLPSVDTPSPLLFPDAKIETGVPVIRLGLVYQQGDTVETISTYEESEGKSLLKVHVKEARYLPLREDGQLPNTFCKCFVTGKRKSAKKKTEIYLRASEPLWDAEIAFDGIPFEDLENRGFEVQVWDEVEGKTATQIGFVRLGLGQLSAEWDDSVEKEIALWQSMLQKLNEWSYMLLPLREPEKVASRSFSRPESTEPSVTSEIRKDIDLLIDSQIEMETSVTPKQSNGEVKSPKALALEAMGDSASNVITILETQNKSARRDQETERTQPVAVTIEVPKNSSYDNGADLSLSPIQEEAEETESLAGEPQAPFYQPAPLQPVINRVEESRPHERGPVLPNVVITTPHDEVRPGDPPFPVKPVPEYQWDEEDEDAKVGGKKSKKEKKEEKMKAKLMKRPGFGSQDSLGSIQSARSEDGVYGRVVVRGDLQLGLQYDYGSGTLEVHIFQARNLAAVDTRNSTSDSYVKTYLMPDKTKATKRKTRVKKNTLDPEWNQIIEYKVSVPDLRTRVLVVQVWNRDRLSRNDFLGEIQFQFEELIDQRKLSNADPVWHPLCEKGPLLEPARWKGNLKVLLMFEDPELKAQRSESSKKDKDKDGEKKKKKKSKSKSKLIVNIVEASDLPAGDLDGYSDPYCKLQLLPLKGKTKKKTHTIRHTLNPVWDYRTEYDVDYEDLAELGLEITVWDWDRGSKDDFLGCLRLNLGEKNSGWDDAEGLELEAWKALMNKPNRLHEFNFPLRSVRDNQTDN